MWGIWMLGLLASGAQADGLHVDGVLKVQGMNMQGARVTVVDRNGGAQVLVGDLDAFELDLELNTVYLCSFERPGCVAKEVLIDTHVPGALPGAQEYTFPLKVTLAPPPDGQEFNYAGPVGRIRYDGHVGDFRYEMEERAQRDAVLEQRLDQVRAEHADSALQGRGREVTASTRAKEEAPAQPEAGVPETFVTVAPTVGLSAALVQVTEVPAESEVVRVLPHLPEVVRMEPVADEPELLLDAGMLRMATERSQLRGHAVVRTKEVRTGKLFLVTTVEVDNGTRRDEYRRVVSYYGNISYFKNGQPCSSLTYLQGVTE